MGITNNKKTATSVRFFYKKPQRVCGFFIANKLKLIIGYLHTSATALAK